MSEAVHIWELSFILLQIWCMIKFESTFCANKEDLTSLCNVDYWGC